MAPIVPPQTQIPHIPPPAPPADPATEADVARALQYKENIVNSLKDGVGSYVAVIEADSYLLQVARSFAGYDSLHKRVADLGRTIAQSRNEHRLDGVGWAYVEVPLPDGTVPSAQNPPLPKLSMLADIEKLTWAEARALLLAWGEPAPHGPEELHTAIWDIRSIVGVRRGLRLGYS